MPPNQTLGPVHDPTRKPESAPNTLPAAAENADPEPMLSQPKEPFGA